MNGQEKLYQDNYVKLRYLENHDQDRAAQIIPDEAKLLNWTAFCYFQKGMMLLYGGQEVGQNHRPSLFDPDRVCWDTGKNYSDFLAKLARIKKDSILTDSRYSVSALPEDTLVAVHDRQGEKLIGIFCVGGTGTDVQVPLADGVYRELISDRTITVIGGCVHTTGLPMIIHNLILE